MESLLRRLDGGIFAVAKPTGESSFHTVQRIKFALVDKILSRISITPKLDTTARKRVSKLLKVGHGGTLDPIATGVLVIGLGSGCKTLGSHFLKKSFKTYRAKGRFGSATDTQDRTGIVIKSCPYEHISRESVINAISENFTGDIMQCPPSFSALHINGERAYDLARRKQASTILAKKQASELDANKFSSTSKNSNHLLSNNNFPLYSEVNVETSSLIHSNAENNDPVCEDLGTQNSSVPISIEQLSTKPDNDNLLVFNNFRLDKKEIENIESEIVLAARPVTIKRFELLEFDIPDFNVEIECSSGTYIRTLVNDLGVAVNSVATMQELERTCQGPFKISESFSIDDDIIASDMDTIIEKIDSLRSLIPTSDVSNF